MSLREWYGKREILLTGVTSELGRNLLEKILRSFPEVKVHLVVRTANKQSDQDRVKSIFASLGYERLRQEDPKAFSRVTIWEGNLVSNDLGLSDVDIAKMKNVSVVFHAGGPHDAIFQFSEELPNFEVLAAASSIFRHKGQINECLQNEHTPKVSLALVRVALLAPPFREPIPGHVEILKGPTAFMVGSGYVRARADKPAELTPIDIATNTLIAAAWERAHRPKEAGPIVYNAATIDCTWGDLMAKGDRASRRFPYPTFGIRGITSIAWLHWIVVLLLEWLPSVFCDTIVGLCGGKQRILREHEKARKALKSLESIAWRSWAAERNRIQVLQQRLSPDDQEAFPLQAELDIENYILSTSASTRKHCVDENVVTLVRNFRYMFFTLAGLFLVYSLVNVGRVLVN